MEVGTVTTGAFNFSFGMRHADLTPAEVATDWAANELASCSYDGVGPSFREALLMAAGTLSLIQLF